jgi:predicted pyridoxine 5'-phosphate oxidase superfamily flavin-nucleotide-binding protein
MIMHNRPASPGFHSGELSVQRRAGVADDARRLEGMLARADLDGGPAAFLRQRQFAALTARDHLGHLWTSPLLGPVGFLEAHSTTLLIGATPDLSDPLHRLPAGQAVGILAIDFATRRRFRVNGTLTSTGADGLHVAVDQAFGNCPSYIQQRHLTLHLDAATPALPTEDPADRLTPTDAALIAKSDTFFLGTVHSITGADTSHRGGPPGFVRVDGPDLWWPDYAGNNMFNSMGNIAANPDTALLVVDFHTGTTVHMSGTATLEWTAAGLPGDDGNTGRRVRFHPARVAHTKGLPVRASGVTPSPDNPELNAEPASKRSMPRSQCRPPG